MTLPKIPALAASAATIPTAANVGPTLLIPDGYVVLNDTEMVERLIADDNDMVALLAALRRKHLMDGGGPLFEAFTRMSGTLEMLAVEVRHIRNLLGGA
jgi:hypothetical protein